MIINRRCIIKGRKPSTPRAQLAENFTYVLAIFSLETKIN